MKTRIKFQAAALFVSLFGLAAAPALAQAPVTTIDAEGTAHIDGGRIPLSTILSPESQAIVKRARPTEGPGAAKPPETQD
jgi:hypothetical protein